MKNSFKCSLVAVGTCVFAAVMYYFFLPALNLHSEGFWCYLFMVSLVIMLLVASVFNMEPNWDDNAPLERVAVLLGGSICLLCIVVLAGGSFISGAMFHASEYRALLDVQTGDFASEVSEVSYNRIPMLDRASATQIGKRALGNISTDSDMVSQFEVSDDYAQINYQGKPVRVSPLKYGGLVKWLNNHNNGIPGYVVVDMVTQEANLVKLAKGMRYTTSEHFGRNLRRYLRFRYPSMMFGDVNFEIDDDGQPWWVCSREVRTISLFGGADTKGAVLVNAVTGEHQYYEEVPSWVDRVYSADLLLAQYNYHGTLVSGWLNSWLGQKGVTVTTAGYNYIALNDDVFMYTGVTSAGNDESNVGFILVNQRTKEARYYHVTGAEEYSAMSSAEGAVQHLHYSATFPILLNISDEPTYFMALKDGAQLVKMYAMVNVGDYQITATGATVKACQSAYEQLLEENGITVTEPIEEVESPENNLEMVSGTVTELFNSVVDGNSMYIFAIEGREVYYSISVKDAPMAPLLAVGKRVTIGCEPNEQPGTVIRTMTLAFD